MGRPEARHGKRELSLFLRQKSAGTIVLLAPSILTAQSKAFYTLRHLSCFRIRAWLYVCIFRCLGCPV